MRSATKGEINVVRKLFQEDRSGEVRSRPQPVLDASADEGLIHLLELDGTPKGMGSVFMFGDGEFREIGGMLVLGEIGGFLRFQDLLCWSLVSHGVLFTPWRSEAEPGGLDVGTWFAVATPMSRSAKNLENVGFELFEPSRRLLDARERSLGKPANTEKSFYYLDAAARYGDYLKAFYDVTDQQTLQRTNKQSNTLETITFDCRLKLRNPDTRAAASARI